MAAPIFLLSDFGMHDAYVGIVRAVVAGIAPDAPVHDLLHEVPPQDVLAARLQLAAALPYLPDDAVVAAIVDPGVGSDRDAVAVDTRSPTGRRLRLVAPDNGLLTSVITDERSPYGSDLRVRAAWRLDPRAFERRGRGTTFDGRDLFAPSAARWARGDPPADFAHPVEVDALTTATAPALLPLADAVRGRVAWIDRFGDLVSDVPVPEGRRFRVRFASSATGREVVLEGPKASFADVEIDEPLAYLGSLGTVEIAVRDGSAADAFGALRGMPLDVTVFDGPAGSDR